jgi:hypothetical protein
MNILDENIVAEQYELLQNRGIKIKQIGLDIGHWGMDDKEIIPLLHRLNSATFFTRDRDFSHRYLCHANYCLVHLIVGPGEVAAFVRRVLRHPALSTRAKRMGKVIRVTHDRLQVWQLHAQEREILEWP